MPVRWRVAVEVLLRAAELLDSTGAGGGGGLLEDCRSAADGTVPPPSCRTELPHALGTCALGFEDECRAVGWWSQQTLSLFPDDKADTIVMEWTPQASQLACALRHNLHLCTAEVISSDEQMHAFDS